MLLSWFRHASVIMSAVYSIAGAEVVPSGAGDGVPGAGEVAGAVVAAGAAVATGAGVGANSPSKFTTEQIE